MHNKSNGSDFIIIIQLLHMQGSNEENGRVCIPLDELSLWEYLTKFFFFFAAGDALNRICILVLGWQKEHEL